MDFTARDNSFIRSSRLSTMYGHEAAREVGQLDSFDAGELRHVASFLRESRTDNEWWRAHIFANTAGETICFTYAFDGETYQSDVWGDIL